ncbi:hypothetical protein Tco_1384135, partial [Tanacetum coccineum]
MKINNQDSSYCHNDAPITRQSVHPGNSRDVMFWNDVWLECGVRLKDKYPRFFALETNQDCLETVYWKYRNGSWVGDWNVNHDRWQWSLAHDGHFSVNHLSKLVNDKVLDGFALSRNHIWNNLVPIK